MSALGNTMLGYAELAISTLATTRFATVTGYNPTDHTGSVIIETDGTTFKDLPIANPMATDTMTFRVGLVIGAHVMITPELSDNGCYVIVGSVHSTTHRPPNARKTIDGDANAVTNSGEITVIAQGGATMRFNNDGSLFFLSPAKIEMQAPTLNIKANVNITGNAVVTGTGRFTQNLSSDKDVLDKHNSVDHLRTTVNTHAHTGVTTGSGTSGTTTITD